MTTMQHLVAEYIACKQIQSRLSVMETDFEFKHKDAAAAAKYNPDNDVLEREAEMWRIVYSMVHRELDSLSMTMQSLSKRMQAIQNQEGAEQDGK